MLGCLLPQHSKDVWRFKAPQPVTLPCFLTPEALCCNTTKNNVESPRENERKKQYITKTYNKNRQIHNTTQK